MHAAQGSSRSLLLVVAIRSNGILFFMTLPCILSFRKILHIECKKFLIINFYFLSRIYPDNWDEIFNIFPLSHVFILIG